MKIFETNDIIGSYRIVRPLGTGGMGMVYEVEHTKLKVHRALKVFAVENENVELHRKRFLSEGKMLSALDHPRVIRVHEFEVDAQSGLPYFVMELVLSPDGTPRTLEDERRSGMDESQAARWFADICEGLDYVHSLGIVHRDVKLENVLIGPDGRAILSDFGISRIFDDELRQRLDITLTMPQDEKVLNCLGSVHYLAPELQGANPEKATICSDAWALGILLFRLLTGFWFESENREKCLKILEDYNFKWSPLVDRLCAVNPAERIPVGGFNKLAPTASEVSAPPPKRLGWLWGAVAALVVAVGVGGYFALSPVQPPIADNEPNEMESMNLGLRVSVDFTDLQLMNNGEPVLIPGVAAETKFLSLAWDEDTLTNTLAKANGDPIPALIQSARPYPANPVRGIRVEILRPDALLANRQEEAEQSRIFKELSPTNLASMLVQLEPTSDFSSTSNCCLTAELKYDSPSCGEGAATWLRSLTEGLDSSPITNVIEATNGTVRIAMTYHCNEGGKIVGQVVMKALTTNREDERRARSRAADSNQEVVKIPLARQNAVRQAEEKYLRRQLYDPVVQAFANEPVDVQARWKGVLTTAEILLDSIGGYAFDTRREFTGHYAVDAYTNGCRYPLPIAYAFASKTKQISRIQTAYSNLYVNLEHDMRWNAATRMQFFGYMSIVDRVMDMDLSNAPPSLTNACLQALVKATRQFLVEKDYSADEIGMVFHLVRRSSKNFDICGLLDSIRNDGIALDPWLDLMLRAKAARDKAWAARGDGFANTVTPEGWRIYEEELSKAFPMLEKAYQLRPELVWSCQLALQSAYDDRYARELWLQRLFAGDQELARGLSFYLWALRPRWGGSRQEMADFLVGLAQKWQFDTMIPIFAYERIVTDVFASEGGLSLKSGDFPNVDKYILSLHQIFRPYFEGYRKSRLEERLPFIRRTHLYIALADLAWRLEDEKELLYWSEKFQSLQIPASETHFGKGYHKFAPYLATIRKIDESKRHDFLVGLHALDMDGNPAAIDKMKQIAEEVGETKLAFECVLSRKGTVDLRPFVTSSKGGKSGAKCLNLNFNGHQRDHMIFRCKLRSGMNLKYTRFRLDVNCSSNRALANENAEGISVGGFRGTISGGSVEWPENEDVCSFELEIVGDQARLTQNGVRLQEKQITDLPSLCSFFNVFGFFGIETTILKLEMEVLDGMDFVIPSKPQLVAVPLTAASIKAQSSWLKYNHKERMPIVGGVKCALALDGRDINEHDQRKNRPTIDGDEVYVMDGNWYGYYCPLNELDEIKDACTIILECGPLLKPLPPDGECMLGSFSLSDNVLRGKQDRVMAAVDIASGDVYAIAQDNVSRWKGTGRIDINAFPCTLAFAYDYAHGLVVYQRTPDGTWKTLVSCDKCRYRGEGPRGFWFGRCGKTGLPFKHLVGSTIRSVSVYPKVLTPEELNFL